MNTISILRNLQGQEVEVNIEAETEVEFDTEIQLEIAEEETHFLSQSILAMLALIALNALALTYLRKAKGKYPKVARYVQDTAVTTLIGMMAGLLLQLTDQKEILYMIKNGYQNFFMIVLLPPILFESTINMHKKSFFRNIGTILMFAVFGTLLASCLTALGTYAISYYNLISDFKFTLRESFAFGTLISSTDPVSVLSIFKEMNADQTLYSLIFGESILNDAIAMVLYNTIASSSIDGYEGVWINSTIHFILLLFGSICIGFAIGILCAMILKTYFEKSNNDTATTETTLMIVIPWAAYLIGESFNLSGVVTLLFCGISMTKYALPYLSETGKNLTQSLYSTLSSTAENLAFIFIGVGFFSFEHQWVQISWVGLLMTFSVIVASRYIQVTIISYIMNFFRSQEKITKSYQNVMIYCGFRGSMAFALAANAVVVFASNGAGNLMLTLTLFYATLNIFVQGSFLVPIIEYFNVKAKAEDSVIIEDEDPLESSFWKIFKRTIQKLESGLAKLIVSSSEMSRVVLPEELEHSLSKIKGRKMLQEGQETELSKIRRIQSDNCCYNTNSKSFEIQSGVEIVIPEMRDASLIVKRTMLE